MPRHTRECRELEPPAGALRWVPAASHALKIHLELTAHVEHVINLSHSTINVHITTVIMSHMIPKYALDIFFCSILHQC